MAKVYADATHNFQIIPTVILPNGGILESHLNYLLEHEIRSLSWKRQSTQAVLMLINYKIRNEGCFKNPQELFIRFVSAIYAGTVDKNGNDPTHLFWTPKSNNTGNVLVKHVTKFSEWLNNETKGRTDLLNKLRAATEYEKLMMQAAYNHRYENAFLKHTMRKRLKPEDTNMSRRIRPRREEKSNSQPPKAFPEDRIEDLLLNGFIKPGTLPTAPPHIRLNLKNVLITMLMHYTGLRLSECFHIYISDIDWKFININGRPQQIPDINIFHPSEGQSPEQKYKNRAHYLKAKFGLQDRLNAVEQHYHAGWKSPALDGERNSKSMKVVFYPTYIEQVWFSLWCLYLQHQRVEPTGEQLSHPFAFTNQYGEPASMSAYKKAHTRAIRKIGLNPSKQAGTTPHGHRHAMGQRLKKSYIPDKVIQKILHHKSILSQQVYKEPSNAEIRAALSETEKDIIEHDLDHLYNDLLSTT